MMGIVWVGRLFGWRRPRVTVAAYGPRAGTRERRLVDLLVECTDGSARVRCIAELTLQAELEAFPASEWPRLDEELRSWLHMPDTFRKTIPVGANSAALPLFASYHSGFVRELAVQALAGWRDGRELPALLVRANDWVPQVRAKASDALLARVTPDYVRHWVGNLGLVDRLRRTGRADHRLLVEGVLALLAAPEVRPVLLEGRASLDTRGRGLLASVLFGGISPRDHDIVAAGLESADPLTRVAAAGAAERLDDEGVRRVLPLMHADPLPRIRVMGIRLAVERIGSAEIEVLRRALLDRSAAVGAEARRGITALEPMDFAAFYRERLHPDRPGLARVIEGLHETGGPSDAALVRPFVDHPLPRVRAAALRALDRFGGEGLEDFLLLAVADPNRGVSGTATKLLRPHVAKVEPGELAALFSADLPRWTRKNALSLLAVRGKWIALPWLIRGTADPDETAAAHAGVLLRRWRDRFNRGFTQPTPEQRAEAVAALGGYVDRDPARRSAWFVEQKRNPPMREWLQYILETGG
ncbi:MAG TPA: hypothetical protein VGB66_10680 [Longimicrobium sp.]|jgi:HEAT repeat protein